MATQPVGFAHVDGAWFAGPFVDLFEDVPVDRAMVVEVEGPRDGVALELEDPAHGDGPFLLCQRRRVAGTKKIAEDPSVLRNL